MKSEKIHEIAENAFAELYPLLNTEAKCDTNISEAKRTAAGLIQYKGQKRRLGIERVIRLIEKYAPDAFDIQITITKKGPPAL